MSLAERLIDTYLGEADKPRSVLSKIDKLPGGKYVPIKKDKGAVGGEKYDLTMKGDRTKQVKAELQKQGFSSAGTWTSATDVKYDVFKKGDIKVRVAADKGKTRVSSMKAGKQPGIPMD